MSVSSFTSMRRQSLSDFTSLLSKSFPRRFLWFPPSPPLTTQLDPSESTFLPEVLWERLMIPGLPLHPTVTIRYTAASTSTRQQCCHAPFGTEWISLSWCHDENRVFWEKCVTKEELEAKKKVAANDFDRCVGALAWKLESVWGLCLAEEKGCGAAIYQHVIYVLIKLNDWKAIFCLERNPF